MLDSLIRDVCGEPEPIQHQVIDVVAKTWRSTWDQTERKLQKISGIKQTTIATLAEILSITSMPSLPFVHRTRFFSFFQLSLDPKRALASFVVWYKSRTNAISGRTIQAYFGFGLIVF